MLIQEYFTFSSHDLRYISVSLIRKKSNTWKQNKKPAYNE